MAFDGDNNRAPCTEGRQTQFHYRTHCAPNMLEAHIRLIGKLIFDVTE